MIGWLETKGPAAAALLALAVAAGPVFARGPEPATPARAHEYLNPEAATGFTARRDVVADRHMVVAANPLASQAGLAVLDQGGSAADAAIAMQLVLGLVEPQSSGLGGGGFALAYGADDGVLRAFDGRETAPASARPDRFLQNGKPMPFRHAMNSGLSVGIPGLVALLGELHARHGVLPWSQLFTPAIRLAREGFPVSPRMHSLLEGSDGLRDSPTAGPHFYDAKGQPWPVGHILRNPAYADTLELLAQAGPDAFYHGAIPLAIVQAVASHDMPGQLTLDDFAAYEVRVGDALCMPYRRYQLCGSPPPGSGALAVMQMLGMLQHTPLAALAPASVDAIHYFSEAGRLAFADRDRYVADPGFVEVPVDGMLDAAYLKARASGIRADTSLGVAAPGVPPGAPPRAPDTTQEQASTTHLVAVDAWGNAVSMTSSVESAFGNKQMVGGFLLNNQLTDFALAPAAADGAPLANRVEPGKRPRSSMAPMVVMADGEPYFLVGSPGGSAIINFVAKAMVGVLDWNLSVQQAFDAPHYGSRNRATELEAGRFDDKVLAALRERGHEVREQAFPSGLHGILRLPDGRLQGGADPRREGLALGR